MASISRNKSSDKTSILEEVTHRGFQELELSQPRWGEIPEKFFRIVDRLKKTEAKNESTQSISDIRSGAEELTAKNRYQRYRQT